MVLWVSIIQLVSKFYSLSEVVPRWSFSSPSLRKKTVLFSILRTHIPLQQMTWQIEYQYLCYHCPYLVCLRDIPGGLEVISYSWKVWQASLEERAATQYLMHCFINNHSQGPQLKSFITTRNIVFPLPLKYRRYISGSSAVPRLVTVSHTPYLSCSF